MTRHKREIKWRPGDVAAAKKVLHHHETVRDALDDISKAIGRPITENALKGAFTKLDEKSPGKYLKPRPEPAAPRDWLKARVDARDNNRKRHIRGLTDIVLEKVESALAKIQPDVIKVTHEKLPIVAGESELLWCEVSDMQLGSRIDLSQTGGINSHDWATWLAKLTKWEETVAQIIRERGSVVPLEGVILSFLGDIADGHGIFASQPYELDADIYEQVIYGARDIAQTIERLASRFPDISFTIYGVGGNHGRIGRKGEAPYRCNFDLLIYEFVRLPNTVCRFSEAWFQLVETWGWTHLLNHGDDVRGWGGLPFYGLARMVAKYNQVLRRPVNYTHSGHFHAEASISSAIGDVIINGAWPGGSMFSAKQLIESNVPVQLVHGITEASGIVWTRKVYLKTREESRPRLTIYRHGKRRAA